MINVAGHFGRLDLFQLKVNRQAHQRLESQVRVAPTKRSDRGRPNL